MPSHNEQSLEKESTKTVVFGPPERTLATLLCEEPGTLDELLLIFLQVLRLLDSMHHSGLHHHRLLPASIRLDENGKPSIHTRGKLTVNSQPFAVTEPKYVLPESFWEDGEDQPCSASDCYVLGFIFYELLLGRRQFKAQFTDVESGPASAWLSWHADRSRKLVPLSELLPKFPVLLSQIIGEMTEKNPVDRTSDLQSIVRRIESVNEATVTMAPSSAGGDTTTFVSSKAHSPDRKIQQKRLFSLSGRSERNASPAQETRESQGGEDGENTAKPDEFFQPVEEHRAAANKVVKRVPEEVKPPSGDSSHPKRAGWKHVFAENHKRRLFFKRIGRKGAFGITALCFVIALLAAPLFVGRHANVPVSPSRQVAVGLQANVSKAEFTVDGKRVSSTSINLVPGFHQAVAAAEGYEPASETFTVRENTSITVIFTLQPALSSLRFESPIKEVKYVLDGAVPADLKNGVLTANHVISGSHTLRVLKNNQQIFSLNFQTTPHRMIEVGAYTAPEDVSAFILSSFQDSAKLYATPDWKIHLGDESSHTAGPDGLDVPLQSTGKSQVLAESFSGSVQKLDPERSRTPILSVSLKSLPPKVPITLLANVSNPVVVVNGRLEGLRLKKGRGVLWLLPGTHKIKLVHDNYYDSAEKTVNAKSPGKKLARVQFTLNPFKQSPVLVLDRELKGAEYRVDGAVVTAKEAKGRLVIPLQAGRHLVTVKQKNFESYSLSRNFTAGQIINLDTSKMKALAPVLFKANPASAMFSYQKQSGGQVAQVSSGTTVALPAGEYLISASAPNFETAKQRVALASGKPVTVDLTLPPAAKGKISDKGLAAPTSPNLFSVTDDWQKDADGWWVHNRPGYAFLGQNQGSFFLAIRQSNQRSLNSKNKKIAFVVNYKGENDRVLYSLDKHHLYRKVFPGKITQNEYRKRHGSWDRTYTLRIAITPEKVILQDGDGKILDFFVLVSGNNLGKFGFLGPVAVKSGTL